MNVLQKIFPDLDGTWGVVDLNKEAQGIVTKAFNPLLVPSTQANYIKDLHLQKKIDYSYGGYLEDRSTLWSGSYLDSAIALHGQIIHLGVDFNVPAKSFVHLPYDGKVVFRTHDKDQNGGWGGRVDFYNQQGEFYFILGHLDPKAAMHVLNTTLSRGTMMGWVGGSKVNGGWFPHLHLQIVSKDEYESFFDPMEIDGYGFGERLNVRYPDPLQAR